MPANPGAYAITTHSNQSTIENYKSKKTQPTALTMAPLIANRHMEIHKRQVIYWQMAKRRPKRLRDSKTNCFCDQPKERQPFSCNSIVQYTGKDRTIDVLRKMPQDIGDMIGKLILHNQLMSGQGNALMTRKIMSWLGGHQCFEEWLGNIPKETYFLPHTRQMGACISTRSSAPCHFFPFTIYTYQNREKVSFEVMVPAWWIDIWFKGRAQAVKCANSWGYAEDTETNWYDMLSRGTPTLGQWCWMAVQHTLHPQQWHLKMVKDTKRCYTPNNEGVHPDFSGYIPGFPNCNSPSLNNKRAKKDFAEMCKGFAYKGKAPVAWITAKNTGKSYDPKYYYSEGDYLGNKKRGMRGMKFAENRFWFKNEYPTW